MDIYLYFQIHFIMDQNGKTESELIGTIENNQKCMFFPLGALVQNVISGTEDPL